MKNSAASARKIASGSMTSSRRAKGRASLFA
jgi:hypothetical protein